MFPIFSVSDSAYSRHRNSELRRQNSLSFAAHVTMVNLYYLLFGQFVAKMLHAPRGAALLDHIGDILVVGAQKQMVGIHTGPHVAPMKYVKAKWDWPPKNLPRKAMGEHDRRPIVLNACHPISGRIKAFRPQPAPAHCIRLGYALKPFWRPFIHGLHYLVANRRAIK